MEQLRKSRLNCWIKDIGRSKHMLDTRYYEGYEGEGEVKVWSEENGNEDGIVIWIGFFNTILEGCFSSEFQKNGIRNSLTEHRRKFGNLEKNSAI